MEAAIPIQNIYYLLCYAWDSLEERDVIDISGIDASHVVNLFAKVLIGGCIHLFKRGIDRGYMTQQEDLRGVRGKIDISSGVKRDLFSRGCASCIFDELSHDILHNQILRTTLAKLISVSELDHKLREKLVQFYRRFHEVSSIRITSSTFRRVQLNRNNSFYDFLLKICSLVNENLLPTANPGVSRFRDFIRDEKTMAYLFEEFVRKFYTREQVHYKVSREDINWKATALNKQSAELLPKMVTDISLKSPERKIIIDTKYYKKTLKTNYDKEKIISSNLYQIYAYVKNVELDSKEQRCEAMLLYPTVQREISAGFDMEGHRITVNTINLAQDWTGIHRDLIGLLEIKGEGGLLR